MAFRVTHAFMGLVTIAAFQEPKFKYCTRLQTGDMDQQSVWIEMVGVASRLGVRAPIWLIVFDYQHFLFRL